MEQITEGVNNIAIVDSSAIKKNRIQVSNTKKPLFFYVNLAKRYMQQYSEVELSALGMDVSMKYDQTLWNIMIWLLAGEVLGYLNHVGLRAIATVVTITEILKNNGLVVEKKITTSTVDINESGGRPVQKAKIEIVLGKSENFDELMAAAAAASAAAAAEAEEEQQG